MLKSATIRFTHRGSLTFHMAKSIGSADTENIIDRCFGKAMRNKCVGSIVIDEDNPLIIDFNMSKNTFTLRCKYIITNNFGITVSH